MEKNESRHFHRQRSIRDIQGAISKMNPQLLKSVIDGGDTTTTTSTPTLPHLYSSNGDDVAPLTIFYKGSVVVFHLPPHKAENILKIAEEEKKAKVGISISSAAKPEHEHHHHHHHHHHLEGDLPIARRKSLQRFLEKRKERLTLLPPPYGNTNTTTTTSAAATVHLLL